MPDKKTSLPYRIIKGLLKLCYPAITLEGLAHLPKEPAIIVANHTQMNGPIASELHFPGPKYIWCAGQMMKWKEVPEYAYQDFWSQKPKRSRWFYKLLSYLITPLSVCVFNNAHTIAVYKDARLLSTFRDTVSKLQEGNNVIIFPEHDVPHNHIVYDFQDKFVDIAKTYYKRTGTALTFVPMYIAPKLGKMYLGEPIPFDPSNPIKEERSRICKQLMDAITAIACALPEHTVIPYRNIPRKHYPSNIPSEVTAHEKAGR